MKYGEIFELTGKGKLHSISDKLNDQMNANDAALSLDPENDDLKRNKRKIEIRQGQERSLRRAIERRAVGDRPGSRLHMKFARLDRLYGKLATLDPSKPDEWLQKKMLGKILNGKLG